MSGSNYGGKQPTNTTYVKQFVSVVAGYANWVYKDKFSPISRYITPATPDNVVLEKNLTVKGSIITPSDINLKENIKELTNDFSLGILSINPKQYNLKADETKKIHYGVLAQEIEQHFPELVLLNQSNNVRSVNYMELIPVMIVRMKGMQEEIDELKKQRLNK
jgi:hypothetical protein